MSSPDTPDWVPGQTGLAIEQTLYSTPQPIPALPIDSGQLDMSPWASLVVQCVLFGVLGTDYAQITVTWLDGAGNVSIENYVISGSPTSPAFVIEQTLRIPAKAQFVDVTALGSSGGLTLAMDIIGSTRVLTDPVIVDTYNNLQTFPVATGTVNINAGQTINFHVGPFAKGFFLAGLGTNALVTIDVIAHHYTGSGFSTTRAGRLVTTAGVTAYDTFLIPNTSVDIVVVNADTVAHSYSIFVAPVT